MDELMCLYNEANIYLNRPKINHKYLHKNPKICMCRC